MNIDRMRSLAPPILIISFFFGFSLYSFSEPFTPDSEFYWSLGNFGNEIVSRSPWPAYYWTKTVLIAPQFYLSGFLSAIHVFMFIQLIQIFMIYAAVSLLSKYEKIDLPRKHIIFFVIIFNSIIFWFRGNTYTTGLAQALLYLYLVILYVTQRDFEKSSKRLTFGFGFLLATFLFLNPIIFLLSIIVTITFHLLHIYRIRQVSLSYIFNAAIFVFGVLLSVIFWLYISADIFPGLNWFQTVMYYSMAIDTSDFSTRKGLLILIADPSVFFLLILALIGLVVLLLKKYRGTFLRFIAGIHLQLVLILVCDKLLLNGSLLESPFYSALVMPSASFLVAGIAVELLRELPLNTINSYRPFAVIVILCLYFFTGTINVGRLSSLTLLALGVSFFCLSTFSLGQVMSRFDFKHSSVARYSALLGVLVLTQVFQNADSRFDGNVLRRDYRIELASSENQNLLTEYLRVQKWVVENTLNEEKLLVWVEPKENLVGYASMQLWGPNSLSSGYKISQGEKDSLMVTLPDAFVSYFRNPLAFREFLQSLPANSDPNSSKCRNFPRTDDAFAFTVCLTYFNFN
jgi:hypothetical protein